MTAVPAVSAIDYASPSSPDRGSSPAPVIAPVSAPVSTPIIQEPSQHTSENPATVKIDANASELPTNPAPIEPSFASVSTPVNAPIIQVSPETVATENPALVNADSHTAGLTSGPPIEPLPHSSVVWAKTLELAKQKLNDNNLPPLDLTNLTLQSAEENIEAVVKSLNALKEDEHRKRWRYTWRGKEIVIAERLGEIIRSVGKYSGVVGTAVQCDPQVSALVWAGVQGIMQVCIYNHIFTHRILTTDTILIP